MTRHFSHDIIKQIKQNKKRNIYTLSIVYIFAGQLLLTVFQHSFVYINASHTRQTWFPVIFNVSSSSLVSPILFSDRRGRSLKSPINFSSRLRNYINIFFFYKYLAEKCVCADYITYSQNELTLYRHLLQSKRKQKHKHVFDQSCS